MAKNIQVNLTFTADTKAAQQQMNQLQQQLSNLAATPINATPGTKMAQSLQQAAQKAVELKVALNNATNVDTGKLNFSKFSQELQRNKMSLQDYAMQLKKLGPEGVQAFSQLANSIRQSETPLISLQGKAAALGKTFANTARWMISSSMLQGVMSAFSGTINYAKELNESLTSIRVVTGKSADDMSRFAKEANKAAKALGATTIEYTDASLIYYQQGLSDKEVKARTETTIKLANVVGEQASTVSEWMTAIWNNFDDGSQSLEHYADVLAKLGAATASSADEIAGGIEKFAAVADTIDLSYEYAAAALATITAETRQSEDVVGTSLKTIFARIENLKLGETLEDGTTLGQYSEALAKVGVHIQDANGNLRGMDNILNDIGARWETLGKSEQVALAQSVAGIRQYNQFMALMSNWDVMEENVQMAKDANGELEHQHEIWETGLEGATKRVQANLEEIKNSLLDENDLIPLLNIADGFLTVVGDLIDSLGGLPGLLSIIASIGLKIYGPQAANMLMNMTSGIRSLYGGLTGKTEADKSQAIIDSTSAQLSMTAQTSGIGDNEMVARNELLRTEVGITTQIEDKRNELNNTAKSYLNLLQQIFEQQKLNAQEAAKAVDIAESEAMVAEEKLKGLRGKTFKTSRTVDKQGELSLIEAQEEEFNIQDSDIDELTKRGSAIGKADSFENYSYGPGESATVLKDAEDLVNSSAVDMKETPALQGLREAIGGNEKGYQDKEGDSQETKDENIQRRKGLIKLEEEEKEYQKLKAKGNKLNENEQKTLAKLEKTQKARSNAIKKNTAEVKIYQKNLAENVRTENDATDTIEKLSGGNKELKGAMEDVVASNRDFNKAQGDSNKAMNSAKTTAEGMQGILEDNASHQKTWADTFVTTMQGVASAAAGLQMIHGAVESLSSAIADGSAGFSDYLSAITSVLFALPMMVNGLKTVGDMIHFNTIKTKGLDLITKIFSKTEKKKADEAMANAGKEIAANKAEDASDMADIATDVAQQAASGPAGWVTAAISAALVATILGAFVAVKASNKKQAAEREEQQSANIEAGKKAIEVGEGWKEQSDSMDDLIEEHKRLQAANNGTVEAENKILEAQQAIIEQIPALIDEYNKLKETYTDLGLEEGIKELEGLKSLYDKADVAGKADLMKDIEALTDELDTKANKKLAEESKKGVTAATQKTLDAIGKQTGDKTHGGTIKWHVADFGSDVGEKALAEAMGYEYDGEAIDIKLDARDPAKFIEDYEKLQKFVNDQREKYGDEADDTVREVAEGLDAAKEAYEELKELYGGSQDFNLTALMEENGIKPETINSYEEFLKVKEKFIAAAVKSGKATKEEAEEFFNAQKTLSSYKAIEEQAAAIGEKDGKAIEKRIKDYAKKLTSEEDITTFLKIDFNRFQTKEAFDAQMAYLKEQTEVEENKVEFQTAFDAFESLKSGMGAEDYEKLQDALKWGEDGLYKFSKFLGKEFTAQQEYLADYTIKKAEATLTELEEGLAVLESNLDKVSGKEKEALEDQIELQKIQIELLKIERKEAEETAEKVARERRKMIKDLKEEIDLYHRLNNLQREAEQLSDRISTAKDNAYGAKRIALMDLENEALKAEIRLGDKRIAQLKEEQKWRKQDLEKNNTTGIKINYDSYGNIDNYTEIQMKYITDLDALIDAGKEKTDEYTKLREEYDDFMDLASKYQGTVEEVEEITEESADKQREILENNLEKIEYTVEIKLEVSERELSSLQRQLERLTDDTYDGAEKIVNLQQQANTYLNDIETNKEGIGKTLEAAGVSDEDIKRYMSGDTKGIAEKYNLDDQDIIDALTKYTDGVIESEQGLYDTYQAIKEQFSTSFDAWHEELADVSDQIGKQSTILSNYKNIVDTMGQKRLGITNQDMKNIEDMQNKAAQASVANAKAQMDLTKDTLATVQQKLAESEEGSDIYKYWKEQEEKLNKQLADDTENFTSVWQEAIQTAYDAFAAESARMVKEFDDAIAGANFSSMAELEEYYDRQMEIEDRYLENYKQAYELSKLNRNLEQQLDKTNNVKSVKVLRNLQKEIETIQKSGKQMSEYELNALQKKYDLKLAEIALEDSQNAKSTVRLRRDNEGNFGYIYTANQVEIDKAQQDYEDKLYALQELNDSYLEELQKKIIANRKAMSEELAALNMQDFESDEEYWKAVDKITKKYTDNEKFLLGEVNSVMANNASVRNDDLVNYGSYTGQYVTKTSDWVINFNNTVLGMATGFDDINTFHQNLETAIGDPDAGTGYLGALDSAYDDFQQNLNTTFYNAGVDLENFGDDNDTHLGTNSKAQKAFTSFQDHVNTALFGEGGTKENPTGGVGKDLDDLNEKTKTLASDGKEALIGPDGKGGLANQVQQFYNKYHTPMENATTDATNLDTALGNLKGEYVVKISVPATTEIDNLTTALENLRREIEKLSLTTGVEINNTTSSNNSYKESYTPNNTPNTSTNTANTNSSSTFSMSQLEKSIADLNEVKGFSKGYNMQGQVKGGVLDSDWKEGPYVEGEIIHKGGGIAVSGTFYEVNEDGSFGSLYGYVPPNDNYADIEILGISAKGGNIGYALVRDADKLDAGFGNNHKSRYAWVPLDLVAFDRKTNKATYSTEKLKEKSSIVKGVLPSFDTGGYTGSWGPEGRLAMLHQKEIVLNAHDTENLLTAVSMIREISDKLESNVLAMRYLSAIGNYNAAINTNRNEMLQQEVTIHAEFPNATNHSEIEEAFGNLVNLASQYANRK